MQTLHSNSPAMTIAEDIFSRYPFATLVTFTPDQQLQVRHWPVSYDQQQQQFLGHGPAKDPLLELLCKQRVLEAKLIFQAEHGYVSPTWSEQIKVPTWDYCVVHVSGALSLITEPAQKLAAMNTQVASYENEWRLDQLGHQLKQQMLSAISVISLQIQSMQYRYKMSQNKPQAAKTAISKQLQSPNHNPMLARYQQLWADHLS